jgi:Protein of unknown function (DUF3631)/Bifunctional DNA primase/polymerase, N-terminal
MTPTDVRTYLAGNDYVPVPCNGKRPVLKEWQLRTWTSTDDINGWAATFPGAANTGILCAHTPTLDLDILDERAVDDVVALVRERFEGRGRIMLRYGRRPKVAIPFRTDVPFKKISAALTAPDGSTEQKIEMLCENQQVIVHGIHPDTREPYQWSGGDPHHVKHDELAPITEIEARALVDDVVAVLVSHGYQTADGRAKSLNGNGHDRTDWGQLHENIRAGRDYHESLRDLSCKMIAAGTDPGAVVNILRGLMEQSEAPHDTERWQARYDDIQRLVDGAVKLFRQTEDKDSPPPPAEDPVAPVLDGTAVLANARAYLAKYVAYPSEAALTAHVLWVAYTHLLEAFDSTPRIAFLSAFPESGKTRALEATEPLVCRAVTTINASAAYLFRKAGDETGPPSVLFDEIDTIFGKKVKTEHEDLRGFINGGHRKGATYGRCRVAGNDVLTEEVPCFAAVAMAGLGWLPDTLLSRSVVVRMQRRLSSEKVASFRTRTSIPEGKAIGAQLTAWAQTVQGDAMEAHPELPEDVTDRQADAWEPLLAVADLAGGEWPALAREAATALVKANRETPASLQLRMLQDLRMVFWKNLAAAAAARPKGLPTETVLGELHSLEDAPWSTVNKGEHLSSSQLASDVFDFGVAPVQLRPFLNSENQKRGYPLGTLAIAWRRYLSPLSLPRKAVNGVTAVTRAALDEYFTWVEVDDDGHPVTPVTALTPFGRRERDPEVGTPAQPASAPEREMAKALEAARVSELAKWWRARIAQLRGELSPAMAGAQARKDLHEVLAEEIQADAIDAEIDRVVRAAGERSKSGKQSKRKKK